VRHHHIGALLGALVIGVILVFWARSPRNLDTIPELFIVGTTADFWPFSFRKDGNVTGFDIDVVKEVVKRLNKKMILRDVPFSSLIPQLELGTLDLVAAGMAATPEREARVHFSTPYVGNNPLVMVTYQSVERPVKSVDDLRGRKIYVTPGNALNYVNKLNLDATIKQLGEGLGLLSNPMTVLDVMDSQDVVITELFSLDPQMIQQFKLSVVEIPQTNEQTSIVVAKNSRVLLSEINRALESMEHDGTLQRLRTEWSIM
jgi:polar amino acid transport system substrate-binding protein